MALALIRKSCFSFKFYKYRTIMTSSSRMQKIMEDLQSNPYYEKYAKKISEMQKNSPEQFVQNIEEKLKTEEKTNETQESCLRRYSSLSNPKEKRKNDVAHPDKRLEDIFKLDLVKDKNADEIKDIWLKYHSQKDVIAAIIPVDVYNKILEKTKLYPTFLFPLPRSQGYEFIMSQVLNNEVHFTTLLCYQVHKENSPECLTIVHYNELADEKGVILMRGEFDKNVLDAQEAQCLANQFQMYYGQDHAGKLKLLNDFSNNPDEFKHMDLISELENLSIG